jgi:hypothetical protein
MTDLAPIVPQCHSRPALREESSKKRNHEIHERHEGKKETSRDGERKTGKASDIVILRAYGMRTKNLTTIPK